MIEDLWTIEQVEKFLAPLYAPRTVREKVIFRPEFPKALKPGKQRAWYAGEIRAWLESQREAA